MKEARDHQGVCVCYVFRDCIDICVLVCVVCFVVVLCYSRLGLGLGHISLGQVRLGIVVGLLSKGR